MDFNRKCRDTTAELDNVLHKVARYCFVQNTTVFLQNSKVKKQF
jgi:hypothetical protein